MIFKISLSVSGDSFFPRDIIDEIAGDFIVKSFHNPDDRRSSKDEDLYGFGSILFWHPKEFSVDENITDYENDIVLFITKNYSAFIDKGADDFTLFMEVYFDGGQCNFEIFNKDLLAKLGVFNISIPISVYLLEVAEFQSWENEIKLAWEDYG